MKLLDVYRRAVSTVLPLSIQLWIQRAYLSHRALTGKRKVEVIMNHLPHVVHSGDIAFDIGANVGAYTFELSRLVAPRGSVYAFEPISRNYRTLLRTIDKGKLSNVVPLQLALAEAVGKREMVLPGSDLSAHALGRFYPRESGPREVVPVESLDHLCSSGKVPIPRFIKCDVEGFPDVVLEGAKELIRHHRPTWLIELWNDEEIGYACDLGYKAFYYRDGDIHETTRSVENIGEYFLFPR